MISMCFSTEEHQKAPSRKKPANKLYQKKGENLQPPIAKIFSYFRGASDEADISQMQKYVDEEALKQRKATAEKFKSHGESVYSTNESLPLQCNQQTNLNRTCLNRDFAQQLKGYSTSGRNFPVFSPNNSAREKVGRITVCPNDMRNAATASTVATTFNQISFPDSDKALGDGHCTPVLRTVPPFPGQSNHSPYHGKDDALQSSLSFMNGSPFFKQATFSTQLNDALKKRTIAFNDPNNKFNTLFNLPKYAVLTDSYDTTNFVTTTIPNSSQRGGVWSRNWNPRRCQTATAVENMNLNFSEMGAIDASMPHLLPNFGNIGSSQLLRTAHSTPYVKGQETANRCGLDDTVCKNHLLNGELKRNNQDISPPSSFCSQSSKAFGKNISAREKTSIRDFSNAGHENQIPFQRQLDPFNGAGNTCNCEPNYVGSYSKPQHLEVNVGPVSEVDTTLKRHKETSFEDKKSIHNFNSNASSQIRARSTVKTDDLKNLFQSQDEQRTRLCNIVVQKDEKIRLLEAELKKIKSKGAKNTNRNAPEDTIILMDSKSSIASDDESSHSSNGHSVTLKRVVPHSSSTKIRKPTFQKLQQNLQLNFDGSPKRMTQYFRCRNTSVRASPVQLGTPLYVYVSRKSDSIDQKLQEWHNKHNSYIKWKRIKYGSYKFGTTDVQLTAQHGKLRAKVLNSSWSGGTSTSIENFVAHFEIIERGNTVSDKTTEVLNHENSRR
ncbi:hypothetical protein IE077_002448 [Cardiosporidium cionae]|uniref:Uncharacterized protein n=1 Tax=Cardiosporidium cionae TaxID=476202 RepID=A0ABQ7JAT3_9APIC|nr:hypothetical protein IE077_002448 [Cardiosporidium cionae]|eukprot:KAF8821112.1 hypothetical protein IE077_002448 [Cardiosporidium cionae]